MPTYASVIVPTHDRAATLRSAIAAIQRQTIRDIEILIVGDGPTPEVAGIASAIAAEDRRVRFIAFGKGPRDGGVNCDRGVQRAQSERIFYCDDDDIWLPQHVETLGARLDRFDIVDSMPISIGTMPAEPHPRLHATLVNSGCDFTRKLLAAGRIKLTYDTHIAHRRSCYFALGNPWLTPHGQSVTHLLSAFASAGHVRWLTLPVPTALSLHGASRLRDSDSTRAEEIDGWLQRTASWHPGHLLSQAAFIWHWVRTLFAEPPSPDEDLAGYLGRLGIAWDASPEADQPGPSLAVAMSGRQRRSIELSFDLFQGRAPHTDGLSDVLVDLLDDVLGGCIPTEFALRMLQPFGLAGAIDTLQKMRAQRPDAEHLIAMLEGKRLCEAGRGPEARAIAEWLTRDGRLSEYELMRLLVRVELAEGAADAAVARLEAAWRQWPRMTEIGVELAGTLVNLGRPDEALPVCRTLQAQLPDHRVARALMLAAEQAMRENSIAEGR